MTAILPMPTGTHLILVLRAAITLGAVALSGCAATYDEVIPASIRRPPAGNLQLVEAMSAPKLHLGTAVRWGGSVLTVRGEPNGSVEIEVLERRLDDRGRPLDSGPSDGRFLIRATDGVDSDAYQPGSRITVAGIFQRLEERQVGEARQLLALVEVREYIRWAEFYPQPLYYDPPFYPWPYYGGSYYGGPYYGWPYYNRPYYRRPYYYPRYHLGM